jgi:RNA polymerase sigma factor (sigma-70 family)
MGRRKHIRWQDGSTNPYQVNKKGEFVDEYRVIDSGKTYSDWMESNAPFGRDEDGLFHESPSANPDVLSDEDVAPEMQQSSLSLNEQQLLEEAFQHLTPEQQEVWELVMRQNYSLSEAAEALSLSRSAVQSRLTKAKARFTAYLRDYQGEE